MAGNMLLCEPQQYTSHEDKPPQRISQFEGYMGQDNQEQTCG
jgi:hypothetical protein